MDILLDILETSSKIADFTKGLGSDIEKILRDKGYDNININLQNLDKNSGYLVSWIYEDKHWAEIMITKSKSNKLSLTLSSSNFSSLSPLASSFLHPSRSIPWHNN